MVYYQKQLIIKTIIVYDTKMLSQSLEELELKAKIEVLKVIKVYL